MPRGPRRPARKPRTNLRAAKKVIGKQHKRAAKRNMDTKYVSCVLEGNITPKQGVGVANYLYGFVPVLDENAGQGVSSIINFNLHKAMYDRVRVNGYKITFIPKANVFSADAAQNDTNLTLTGSGTLLTIVDRDGPGPWLTTNMVNTWNQYPSVQTRSLLKKQTRSYHIKYPKGVWLDTANIFEDTSLLNRLGLLGGVSFYAENLVEDAGEVFNEPWGLMRVEYHCVFEGLKPTNTTLDASGNIIMKPIETSFEDARANFTPWGEFYPVLEV